MLNDECPESRGKSIKVFFTDAFEVRADGNDKTSEALTQIYTYAATIDAFECA